MKIKLELWQKEVQRQMNDTEDKVQIHKLKKMKDNLKVFDETKSEYINMASNGFRRIFDSGNKIYIKYF